MKSIPIVPAMLMFGLSALCADALPAFDFTRKEDAGKWQADHDVANVEQTAEGLAFTISGNDPYIIGPARDYPKGVELWMLLRIKSEEGGTCQVFYFTNAASEDESIRFNVRPQEWQEVRIPFPALAPGFHIRIDPPGNRGKAALASLRFEERRRPGVPQWPKPQLPQIDGKSIAFESDGLRIRHDGKSLDGFEIDVGGQSFATGLSPATIGYLIGDKARWIHLGQTAQVGVSRDKRGLIASCTLQDPDGANWHIERHFSVGRSGGIDVETTISADKDRDVVFLPAFVLLPGAGSFGASKHQAIFSGVEYLENEPSSSEADVRGAGSKRQVPNPVKITMPLMCVQAEGRYLGLIWEKSPEVSALFDSPDRIFASEAHVMGLLIPGATADDRVESDTVAYTPKSFKAGVPTTVHATLIGGFGDNVIPAVQKFVKMRGLPPLPVTMNFDEYVAFTASSWLDSKIREGDLYRHAFWEGFHPSPVADAACYMEWLAKQSGDAELRKRLNAAVAGAISKVAPKDYNAAAISHVREPLSSLVFGHSLENAEQAAQRARGMLARFENDGSLLYKNAPKAPDFSTTHFAKEADGLTAHIVATVLQDASISGDPVLIAQGLRVLRALKKFDGTVPRGAQTWEVPLHAPDLLASAHLVKAYVLGYELSGDREFLEKAKYWAWTGVPFVYLENPTSGKVGPYATIAVLGATGWVAPLWIGLPVQWCGLVYANALYRLARYDPDSPWKQLADGITVSGIQQCFPASNSEKHGLLPDSFILREQRSDGPAINPGTVQSNAARLFSKGPMYDFRAFHLAGMFVHAPGLIYDENDQTGKVSFKVDGWCEHPYEVLISGLKSTVTVAVNGKEVEVKQSSGRVALTLGGSAHVEIRSGTK